ncbi:unnamed protein product, partial [Closterium sp. NIES-53]
LLLVKVIASHHIASHRIASHRIPSHPITKCRQAFIRIRTRSPHIPLSPHPLSPPSSSLLLSPPYSSIFISPPSASFLLFPPLSRPPLPPSLPSQLLCVDFNRTWLELEKTRVACQVSAQITPAITTATPPPLVDYMNQGVLVKVLQGPQSCQQLWRAFGVSSPTRFFQMNPGLSCDSLLPYSPLQGNMISRICVAAIDARPLSGVSCSTKRMYSVKRGDTCGMLIVKRYRRSADMFRELNNGYDCAVTGLWIGMLLCLPV